MSSRSDMSGQAWWKGLVPPFCLLAAAFALELAASFGPGLVERYYSRGLFHVVARVFTFARLVSFSLAELLLALLPAAFVLWIVWLARRLYARCGQRRVV